MRPKWFVLWKIRADRRSFEAKKRSGNQIEAVCWKRTWKIHWKTQARETRKKKTKKRMRVKNLRRNQTKGGWRNEEERRGRKREKRVDLIKDARDTW